MPKSMWEAQKKGMKEESAVQYWQARPPSAYRGTAPSTPRHVPDTASPPSAVGKPTGHIELDGAFVGGGAVHAVQQQLAALEQSVYHVVSCGVM